MEGELDWCRDDMRVDARDEMDNRNKVGVGAGVSCMGSLCARIGKVSCNCGIECNEKRHEVGHGENADEREGV
jgi:hypothetical protein